MSILAAFVFGALATAAGVGLNCADLYVVRLRSQRAADLGAQAAANTSSPIVSGAVSATATATAQNVATINGFGSASVVTSVATSPTNDGAQALSTSISQSTPLFLSAFLGNGSAVTVAATSLVEVGSTTGPCVTSTLWQTVDILGSTVRGPNCSVAASALLWVDSTSTLSVKSVATAASSLIESTWIALAGLLSPAAASFTYNATVTDPLSGNASISAIASHLGAMASWPYGTSNPVAIPTLPAITRALAFNYYSGGSHSETSSGIGDPNCTQPTYLGNIEIQSGTNTFTLGSGCYIVSSIYQQSGSTTFTPAAGATVNFIVVGAVSNIAGAMAFGNATYAFGAGFTNSGSSVVFGNGQKEFVGGVANNSTGSMTFGTGPYYVWNGSLINSSSGTMTFGDGPFYFYNGGIDNTSGNVTIGNGPFYFYLGGITTGLGSSTVFGVGNMDLYWASINLSGNTTFGSGGSAVTGSSMISLYGGSLQVFNGNLTASGVTFALTTGVANFWGAGTINATAPTGANPTYGYTNILIDITGVSIPTGTFNGGSTNVGGLFNIYKTGGESNTMSGIVYAPGTFIGVGGQNTISPPTNSCLQMIGSGVFFFGGVTVNLAPCTSGSSTGNVGIAE